MKFIKNKCFYNGQHVSNYVVRYKTYNADEFTLEQITGIVQELERYACYSGFWNKLQKTHTNFLTVFERDESRKIKLTKEEVMLWIRLCKKHDLLPKYLINENCYVEEADKPAKFVLSLYIKNRPQARTYLWIDTFRHLREDPGFIKAILHLHCDCKINFYIAFVLSSQLNIVGTGHHSLNVAKTAYSDNKPYIDPDRLNAKATMINLKLVRSLYKFIKQKKLYNTLDKKICEDAKSWCCNSMISKITSKDLLVPISYIDDKRVEKIATVLDCTVADKLHKEFMEQIRKTADL